MLSSLVLFLLVSLHAGNLAAQPILTLPGPGASSFGSSAATGDFNGDGAVDLAVGAPTGNSSKGDVTVFLSGGAIVTIVPTTLASIPGDLFGFDMEAGDIDKDGLDDLVVGAPGEFGGAGSVYVFFGSTLAPPAPWLPTFINTGIGMDLLGSSVTIVPDTTGDGVDEYAAGAPNGPVSAGSGARGYVDVYNGTTGAVATFFGPNNPPLTSGIVNWGSDLAGGDYDGDGRGDIAVAHIFPTLVGGSIPRIAVVGSTPNGSFPIGGAFLELVNGTTTLNAGDMNGDGIDDFAYGSPSLNNGDGQVSVRAVVPGLILLTAAGGVTGGGFGTVLARAGDVNGDGAVDLAAAGMSGEVRLIAGGAPGQQPIVGLTIEQAFFGSAPASLAAGDANGDSFLDLLVGEPQAGPGGIATVISPVPTPAALTAVNNSVSVQGGTQTYFLDAGSANAGEIAILVASTNQASPGAGQVLNDGSELLLGNSPLLTATMADPSAFLFVGNPVQLDSAGRGIIRFEGVGIPTQQAQALIGQTVFIGYAVLRANPVPTLGSSSNVVSLSFLN